MGIGKSSLNRGSTGAESAQTNGERLYRTSLVSARKKAKVGLM
jgi:hypothetical protein